MDMCQGLGIKTVAEFIENEQLLDVVRDSGVDFAQGFFIGRPQPMDNWVGASGLIEPLAYLERT